MAADRTVKRKRKGSGSTGQGGELLLRQRTDPRSERRFEPKASLSLGLTLLGMSVAALLAGAAVYGQWFRAEEAGPHPVAPYLFVGAVLLGGAAGLFGQWSLKPIRVGDAGVGLENGPTEIERIGWHEVTGLLLSDDTLTVQGSGTAIAIPLRTHLPAASRVLAEVRRRIPARATDIKEGALPPPDDAAGEQRPLEPPQVAGLRCKATDKLIAFEADARLCGRCGELYHKDGVPPRCTTCSAPLS
ncbi:hypothetical protein SOCE26_072710 [Sorangium cellulosum]|uniref:Uncharacterized protein n=1 Tax=Sorangium cellulosum TaxID=56 RepID=A0A2L0F2H0_SORCE|nr:hypothetical protein [Sorangium cellulosum]AUX45775.1 hypothetical protein SOCE26_072710 [Sorangium cellulosum]